MLLLFGSPWPANWAMLLTAWRTAPRVRERRADEAGYETDDRDGRDCGLDRAGASTEASRTDMVSSDRGALAGQGSINEEATHVGIRRKEGKAKIL